MEEILHLRIPFLMRTVEVTAFCGFQWKLNFYTVTLSSFRGRRWASKSILVTIRITILNVAFFYLLLENHEKEVNEWVNEQLM